ncbi:MAG: bifunctional proline dehydrogenase/L-glutamate gamma-semialdehyde dehydrogenase [Deltaproteobacteria bacterium]|nr:bifunctional proline dehydrogenase/L-glutamate gamma-semialdehyde dehydrogenase [Deltaproteobacteria bacterium]
MKPSISDTLSQEAIALAERWQKRANELLSPEERAIQEMMMRLLSSPMDKVILTKMMDQGFRSGSYGRVADQINDLMRTHGIPEFFKVSEKLLMRLFLAMGRHVPSISVPRIIEKMRSDSSRSIIAGEAEALHRHLQMRRAEGVRMNLNHLGEAVLGEEEAADRLQTYLEDLRNPEIEYISVKISTIYSQISSLAFEHTVKILKERLSRLYRTAQSHCFIRQNGVRALKFVNLDMEEYRDLDITHAAFTQTLDEPEFKMHSAGIVLQAYLPDSCDIQIELTEWAKKRVADGGAPIKIRIVKGANMEMELVESSLHNWPLAPYDNKLDVDANYKRMVDYGMIPENIQAVHLGIASHNLFELAYAANLAKHLGVSANMSFEMLEGMADHVRRAIQESTGDMLLYAPVATRDQFINAIAYLIRRLDENTAEENFLRHSFNLKTDSKAWDFLKDQFVNSYHHRKIVPKAPRRSQNRMTETFSAKRSLDAGSFYSDEFTNEADTDWSLEPSRIWANAIRGKWKMAPDSSPLIIPVVAGGVEILEGRPCGECLDISRIGESVDKPLIARYVLADEKDIELAVSVAKADPDGWREKSLAGRHEILSRVAEELRMARADLIGAAAANTGKVFSEGDVEVSEAIDFAEYYPHSARAFTDMHHVRCSGKGVGLVISPWNFPIAIPSGGILAALSAGNTVIFKPASAAVLVAWELCQCFWRAGVSKNVLQFLPCAGSTIGAKLTHHPDVDFIILTGGTDTGMRILKERPAVFLAAETGGKNATIVTAMSDRDQAIKNVIQSAFGHCGQKCSATSLLILEKEVYEDAVFKKQLVDAAGSFSVGTAWAFENRMGPLIQPPSGDLKSALTKLEPGESWALKPENISPNPHMWTPGIKWGVKPGSHTHLTEFFGPVLGVMCAQNLEEAIDLVNQTGYGLTSGIESLDKREQVLWKSRIKAGNLYINRGTTGAIVLRQPFGGMRKSALGSGIKAGGPNYVSQFMNFEETGLPPIGAIQKDSEILRLSRRWRIKLDGNHFPGIEADVSKTIRAIQSYVYRAEQDFQVEKDYFHLRGQDNIVRFLPAGTVAVRLHGDDSLFETLARIAAVRISRCSLLISIPPGLANTTTAFLGSKEGRALLKDAPVVHQTDRDLIQMLSKIQRIRYSHPDRVPSVVLAAAAEKGFYISRMPVLMEGRIELLHYFQEQSICDNYHRYGNLGERAMVSPV